MRDANNEDANQVKNVHAHLGKKHLSTDDQTKLAQKKAKLRKRRGKFSVWQVFMQNVFMGHSKPSSKVYDLFDELNTGKLRLHVMDMWMLRRQNEEIKKLQKERNTAAVTGTNLNFHPVSTFDIDSDELVVNHLKYAKKHYKGMRFQPVLEDTVLYLQVRYGDHYLTLPQENKFMSTRVSVKETWLEAAERGLYEHLGIVDWEKYLSLYKPMPELLDVVDRRMHLGYSRMVVRRTRYFVMSFRVMSKHEVGQKFFKEYATDYTLFNLGLPLIRKRKFLHDFAKSVGSSAAGSRNQSGSGRVTLGADEYEETEGRASPANRNKKNELANRWDGAAMRQSSFYVTRTLDCMYGNLNMDRLNTVRSVLRSERISWMEEMTGKTYDELVLLNVGGPQDGVTASIHYNQMMDLSLSIKEEVENDLSANKDHETGRGFFGIPQTPTALKKQIMLEDKQVSDPAENQSLRAKKIANDFFFMSSALGKHSNKNHMFTNHYGVDNITGSTKKAESSSGKTSANKRWKAAKGTMSIFKAFGGYSNLKRKREQKHIPYKTRELLKGFPVQKQVLDGRHAQDLQRQIEFRWVSLGDVLSAGVVGYMPLPGTFYSTEDPDAYLHTAEPEDEEEDAEQAEIDRRETMDGSPSPRNFAKNEDDIDKILAASKKGTKVNFAGSNVGGKSEDEIMKGLVENSKMMKSKSVMKSSNSLDAPMMSMARPGKGKSMSLAGINEDDMDNDNDNEEGDIGKERATPGKSILAKKGIKEQAKSVSSLLMGLEGCGPGKCSPFSGVGHDTSGKSNHKSVRGGRKWRAYGCNMNNSKFSRELLVPKDLGGMCMTVTAKDFDRFVQVCDQLVDKRFEQSYGYDVQNMMQREIDNDKDHVKKENQRALDLNIFHKSRDLKSLRYHQENLFRDILSVDASMAMPIIMHAASQKFQTTREVERGRKRKGKDLKVRRENSVE